MLTLSGPDTYYDYHGHGMGLQYLLCEKFAQKIGVSLRVDVCKDTLELERKLRKGEADIAALQFDRPLRGLRFTKVKADQAKMGWAVMADNAELADSLDRWFNPQMVKNIRNEEAFLLSSQHKPSCLFAHVKPFGRCHIPLRPLFPDVCADGTHRLAAYGRPVLSGVVLRS